MAASPVSCRILIAASSLSLARDFAHRIKALSGDTPDAEEAGNIPWNIANRYYTAAVHFKPLMLEDCTSGELAGVPAVIFVWSHEQPFRAQAKTLSEVLNENDPEVSLAIQASPSDHSDDEELEVFFSDLGFEYIDGSSSEKPTSGTTAWEDESGPAGLSRAIDALSTVMWPSMVQSQLTRERTSRARGLLGRGRDAEDEAAESMRALLPGAGAGADADGGPAETRRSRMQRELEELERWLEEDGAPSSPDAALWSAPPSAQPLAAAGAGADAWPTAPPPPDPALHAPTIAVSAPDGADAAAGFDDDFSEYVSALAALQPAHTGASYRSLASVSDFGDLDADADVDANVDAGADAGAADDAADPDPDLPSPSEIRAASARIFAPGARGADSAAGAGADFDVPAFDLSRVFGALQSMKEEIAGIQDEGERRHAAARVALGLVYGLEGDDEELGEEFALT